MTMAEELYVIDADAHAVEPVSFFAELFARFPDKVAVVTTSSRWWAAHRPSGPPSPPRGAAARRCS